MKDVSHPAIGTRFARRLPLWPFLVLAGLLVFMPVASVEFNSDGVWYMDHALNVAQGRGLVDVDQQTGLSGRLFFPLFMGAVYRLVGPSDVATYVVLRLFFIFNLLLIYSFTRKLFDRFTGFTAALLVFTSFTLSEWQTIINLDYLIAFWLLLSIFLLYQAFESMRLPLFLLAGLSIAVSLSVKETAFVLVALPPLYWLLIPRYRSRRGLAGVAIALAVLVAAALAFVLLQLSRGGDLRQLMGSFLPLLSQQGSAFAVPSPQGLAEVLSVYYRLHLAPYFFLAPLLVISWFYVAARSIVARGRYQSYRFLTLSSLVFLPQTVILGRIAEQQRPGQNFIVFLLLYVGLAVLVCDMAVGVRRQVETHFPGRLAGPAVQATLVILVIGIQTVESQTTWTGPPGLVFEARGSMIDHWRRFNTVQYLRGTRTWTSRLDGLREVGARLNAITPDGAPVLASLDTMRWLYWTTAGRHPMVHVRDLVWWTPGRTGDETPDTPYGDVALLVVDNAAGDWRVLRQTTFFQALRSRGIRFIALDARDGYLLPFLMEHPAFVLSGEVNDRWLFEVLDESLEPAPGLWRMLGASQEQLAAMQATPEQFQRFEQVVLKDTFGFTDAETGQALTDELRIVPLDHRLRPYVRSFSKLDAENLARLRRTFEAKVQARPDTAWSWVLLAQVAKAQGDGQGAWNAFEQARALGIHDPTAAYWIALETMRLANRYMAAQDYETAARVLQNIAGLGLSPADMRKEVLPSVDKHGDALIGAGYGDNLVAVYQAVQEASPDSDDPYVLIAGVYERMGDWERAAETYRQMIHRFPWHAPAYQGLGQVYLKMGRSEEAMAEFEMAIAKRPDWEPPYAGLIPLLVAGGQGDKALALLQTAADSDPALEWPQQMMAAYELQPAPQ